MGRWLILVFGLALPGCYNGVLLKPTSVSGPIQENVVGDAKSVWCCNKIALVDVSGVIMNAKTGGLLGGEENPVSQFRERLDAAAEDKHVKAVVLRINSPGGGVTASEIMYQDLLRFRKETGKPVIVCMMDVCASGGYYLAMGSDYVIAHPTTVTGSIGVIITLYNATGLATMLGIVSDPIKSGANKDIGNPLRPMSDPERAILQGMVDSFYAQFVEVVMKGRHMTEARVRELADGRVYTGADAKKLGLVDDTGYLEDAIRLAKEMTGVPDAMVVAYDRDDGYRGSIYARTPRIPAEMKVKLELPTATGSAGTGFQYLWEPGVSR